MTVEKKRERERDPRNSSPHLEATTSKRDIYLGKGKNRNDDGDTWARKPTESFFFASLIEPTLDCIQKNEVLRARSLRIVRFACVTHEKCS